MSVPATPDVVVTLNEFQVTHWSKGSFPRRVWSHVGPIPLLVKKVDGG